MMALKALITAFGFILILPVLSLLAVAVCVFLFFVLPIMWFFDIEDYPSDLEYCH